MDTTTDSTRSHRSDRRRGGRALVAVAIPLGVVASGALVWQASYAAFTATTENEGNSWSTGTVSLTDSQGGPDDTDNAMFTAGATPLTPGVTEKCITVTYTGDLAADVEFTSAVVGDALAETLDVIVEAGSGGDVDCNGFVVADAPEATLYTGTLAAIDTGTVDTWAIPAGDVESGDPDPTRTYRIEVTVPDDAAQGESATATFTWTASNT